MYNFESDKILIVGAGLAGSTIGRILAENSFKVVIIEKRDHIAGNIFDFVNEKDERIHKYGPHLLHCRKNSEALKFLSKFTKWVKYEHEVRALLQDGRTTPLPVNKLTIEDIFGKSFQTEEAVKEFLDKIRNKNFIPKNTDELFETTVGNKLADIFFRPYTKKMWGIDPKKLSISVGARLPVRTNDDCRYFNDEFQALPKDGYAKMVKKMLDHKNIEICLDTPFLKGMENQFFHSFLSIPIDEYFNYQFGSLPYRSILFENRLEEGNDLDSPVVNFTDNSPYTRKTQWNLFPNSPNVKSESKTITYEKPCSMDLNPGEYYYPVQTKDSKRIFSLYEELSKNQSSITFIGRTGLFKYIDMIPAVEIHIRLAKKFMRQINKL
ncbi:NAD(P)-binding protein [Prochlorococcus marinus XMU1414]|uniref:NAD(P)-binding protein n=1 Tax=Prochlorococcus marinus XMU1424 TaxID=2774497 RepID=A0A9D9BX10_PROMR|nr:UDP-galactopyranose mutase [Prochlorococcus marinus]MBO8228661.1 NAD(P)-binding protein [Prochlorococcus marinus XMU1414]MBW3046140.1 UDP-galactopyranose mutase [Prochlorococcus marinus str. MU1414]MCR8531568.1 NAD(P)-binding protein [Prochlorococcus marinus XMU1420]MCR8535297.1 NAD(P)-binding protein [Prochlorococcus marinus XMU1424]